MVNQGKWLMAERKVLQDAVSIGGINLFGGAEAAPAFGTLGLEQMPLARA
jgi:hypothetical protein